MKNSYLSVILGLSFLVGLFFLACEGPNQPTYGPGNPDPNPTGLPAAILTSIDPNEGYLKDIVVIHGSGFNPTPVYNLVAFGTKTGTILTASETELTVRTPNISGETVKVKVAVKGSEFWSNELEFTFKEALQVIDDEIVWPNGVAVDDNDNVYIGSAADGVIYKITPAGEKSEFASVPVSGAIEFGPDNYLYVCTQHEGKIVRISPDGATIEDVVEVESPVDFDWDVNDNMYIVANGIGIFKYDTGGGLTQVAEIGNPKSCRVFENYFYVTDIWENRILRYEITASGLENEEVVVEADSPVGLELDSEGTLYYTPAWETSLYTLKPDGSEEILYKGQLMTPMRYLTFYKKSLYIVYPGWGDVGQVMKAYIGVEQAPNYGRD